jgi:hypothetical protein
MRRSTSRAAEISPKDKVFYEVTQARLEDTFSGVADHAEAVHGRQPGGAGAPGRDFEHLKSASKDLLGFVADNFIEAAGIQVTQAQIQQASSAAVDAAGPWSKATARCWTSCSRSAPRPPPRCAMRSWRYWSPACCSSGTCRWALYLSMERAIGKAAGAARALARGELGRMPEAAVERRSSGSC